MKKITIIIPMYNEEKNIKNCINTLLQQTSQNFHVIFIDDGSTDTTVETLVNLLKQKTNNQNFSYELLSQTNAGAAKARENGINACKSIYAMILDCDDLLSENTIELHLKCLEENDNVDIILPKVMIENSEGYKEFPFYNNNKILSGKDCLRNSLGYWGVHGCACIRREILIKSYATYKKYNSLEQNYINNDEIITRLNFLYAENILKNNAIYFYQNNEESTTKKININRFLMCRNAVILIQILKLESPDIKNKAGQELISTMWGTLTYALKHKDSLPNLSDWKSEIKSILRDCKNFQIQKVKISFKSRIQLILASILIHIL